MQPFTQPDNLEGQNWRGAGGSADGEIDFVVVSTNVIIWILIPLPNMHGDINLLP
jgi:hypothetical protein